MTLIAADTPPPALSIEPPPLEYGTTAASARFIRVIAVACGVSVANLYYNQPLLADMGRTFGRSAREVGAVPMLTQGGYAVGLLLLVPLGDILQRRRLVVSLLLAVAVALVGVAVAPGFAWLGAASLAVGVTTVVPQMLIPLAAQLSPSGGRGKAVGTVMMGLLLGVLLSRTASGLIAERFGWRAVYWIASGLMVALAAVLGPLLPAHEVHETLSYGRLLRSVGEQVVRLPVLRQAMLNGGLLFAGFSAFWATLVFRMETSPFHYGSRAAGLYGLVGAVGALAAPIVGQWADRAPPRAILTAAAVLVLASFAVFWAGGSSLCGIGAGVVLLDLAMQGAQVTNMARIYRLSAGAHSRINSAYMFSYFVGGSAGSLLGPWAWSVGRWGGVCAFGAGVSALALVAHLAARPAEDAPPSPAAI